MAQRIFTDESLATLIDETKAYVDSTANELSNDIKNKQFFVTVTNNGDDAYSMDKTYSQIIEAYNAGKLIYCRVTIMDVPLVLSLAVDKMISEIIFFVGQIDVLTISVSITSNDEINIVVFEMSQTSHIHEISEVPGLEEALNKKANSSHGTHVSYGTSASAISSAASAGSASTVSRSDHVHSLSKSAVTTALGYTPVNSNATTSAAGLMSATDKTKLDATNIAYGTCSTAAGTAAKVITISGNTNWKLAAGSMIAVKFTNTNTASNPTFNVNSTGAKPVFYNTAQITTADLLYAGCANKIINYIYNGSQFVFIGWSMDKDTTYSLSSFGITATAAELNYTDGVTSNIQHQLDSKASSTSPKISTSIELHGATPYIDFHYNNDQGDYTSRIIEDSSGNISVNGVGFNGGDVSATNVIASSSVKIGNAVLSYDTDGLSITFETE